jgi:hypothetical protein
MALDHPDDTELVDMSAQLHCFEPACDQQNIRQGSVVARAMDTSPATSGG